MNEEFEKVAQLIADQLNIDIERITLESTLESLGADSIDRVEIVIRLEEAFDAEISDEDAEKIETVRHVVDYLKKQRIKE